MAVTPGESEIQTEGRLVYAYAPVAVTVGGVNFADAKSAGDFADNVLFDVSVFSAENVYWQEREDGWTGSQSYKTLLSNGYWSKRRDPKRLAITLRNLAEGKQYLVQIWFNDMRPQRREACLYAGEKKLSMDDAACRHGTTAVCKFIASNHEETFNIGFNIEGQINALQLRDLEDDTPQDVKLPPSEPKPGWAKRLRLFNPCWTNDQFGTSFSQTLPTAALLGNGSLGVVNGGEGSCKRFVLTRGDLWSCGKLQNGFAGIASSEIMPISFCDLEIECQNPAMRYIDRLDIASATLETRGLFGGAAMRLRSYVASTEDIVLIEGVSSRNTIWNVRLRAHDEVQGFPCDALVMKDGIGIARHTIDNTNGDKRGWTTNATAVLRVLGGEIFHSSAVRASEAMAKVKLFAGKPFALAIMPSRECKIDWKRIDNLRQRHCAWWKEWWTRSTIAIGDEELERYYFGSLYLLGSGARQGKFPPGLYGIWQTTDSPLWHNDFHLNYNYIAPFFGCYAANRPEIAETLPEPLIDYLPRAEINAREKLQKLDWCRHSRGKEHKPYVRNRTDLKDGIGNAALFPVGLGPWGVSSEGDGEYWSQTLNGPYQASAFCTYWEYTRDRKYLKKIWPLLDKVANFYMKWCEREELPDGAHRYVLWDSWCEGGGLMKNCGQTLGAVRHIFETLSGAAGILEELKIKVPDEKLALWRDYAENLSPLPTGLANINGEERRIFSTVETPDDRAVYTGGGGFELEPLNVGDAFSFDSTDEMRAIAVNTILAKLSFGEETVWGGINQTPKLFTTAIRAGFPAKKAIAAFKKYQLAKYGEKNFTLHDKYHGFEKPGAIEFINSMLLQSDHGYVKVFPNWTGEDASFENLRAKGAFIISSEFKSGKVLWIRATSSAGGRLRLVNPWGDTRTTVKQAISGKTRHSGESTIELEMRPGETVEFRP